MSPSRRQFVSTLGVAGAGFALTRAPGVLWTSPHDVPRGWQPGLEERRASSCLVCPARCGVQGRVVDGNLVEVGGNPLHPMSRGGICPRGVAGVQTLYHPDRFDTPLQRVGPRGPVSGVRSRGRRPWRPSRVD